MRRILLLLLVVLFPLTLHAQRERNYIYLLDCTASMNGFGGNPDIWEPTKAYLQCELGKHTPGTMLHVVPFQGNVKPGFSFDAFDAKKWNEINHSIDTLVKQLSGTNICAAWDAACTYIDPHKDNYIILLTDGKDNINGMAAVAKKLSNWCGKYPNSYAFYVQLTEAAIDPDVAKVINICDHEFIIDASKGSIPVFGSIDNAHVYASTLDLDKTHRLPFSTAGTYAAKAVCQDPWFDVQVVGGKIEAGSMAIRIVARQPLAEIHAGIPPTYDFTFDVQSGDATILNPTVQVQMTNKTERTLEMLSEETYMGKATWYDSFLFWWASDPDTISVDLTTAFNDEALKDGSVAELQVTNLGEVGDLQLFYNGQPLVKGKITLRANGPTPSILSLVFRPAEEEGKRYIEIKASAGQQLDKINGQPTEDYHLTLRSEYAVVWNPLKTTLTWATILTCAALLLWFLLLRPIVYPSIKVKTIQITEPYYSKVSVKGKRRVVFTDKAMEQSLLSRIFTGETLYHKRDVWTSPLVLEPGAKNKTLRVIRTKDYVFEPFTSMLTAPNDYVVESTKDKTRIKISIN